MSTTLELEPQSEVKTKKTAKLNKKIEPETTIESRVVMPSVTADEALAAWQAYQDLKAKIIDPKQDIQVIRGQEFKKKSYWRKVATFFNLSIETKDEWKEQLGRTMVWHFTVRATAPNGRFVDGVGSCDVYEKATLHDGKYQTYNAFKKYWEEATPNSPHNVRSTAYTRAYNRAVSDLIAGGEVSAEEIQMSHQSYYDHGQSDYTSELAARQADRRVSQQAVPTEQQPGNSGQFKCEKCDETIPFNAMMKSKDRYDGHTFCFKHQLEYKRSQLQQSSNKTKAAAKQQQQASAS